ncbi:MAG: hypothetical protein IH936_10760 [Acidobacteria bacterium]|nr:hypothetical protein [Acidobacteriota bacterium]
MIDRGIHVLTEKELTSVAEHLEVDGSIYDLVILCQAPVAVESIEEVRARAVEPGWVTRRDTRAAL